MPNLSTSSELAATGAALFSSDRWFDPIEEAVRERVRGFIEEDLEAEVTEALCRVDATNALRPSQPKWRARRR